MNLLQKKERESQKLSLFDFNTNRICINNEDLCIKMDTKRFYITSALVIGSTILYKNRKKVLKLWKKVK